MFNAGVFVVISVKSLFYNRCFDDRGFAIVVTNVKQVHVMSVIIMIQLMA